MTGGTKQITINSRNADRTGNSQESSLKIVTAILGIMWAPYQCAIWFLIPTIIVLVVIVLLYIKGQKKDEIMKKE
jgi:hypothetical protein